VQRSIADDALIVERSRGSMHLLRSAIGAPPSVSSAVAAPPGARFDFGTISILPPAQRSAESGPPVSDDAPAPDDLARRIQAASAIGDALDDGTQRRLEDGLGANLSGVRIHTGNEADSLAHSVHAVAFTTGPDIFFRAGAYNPGSTEGFRLLAHEAAHTVQQATGPVAGTPALGGIAISTPGDAFERAADRAATDAVSRGTDGSAPEPRRDAAWPTATAGVAAAGSLTGLVVQRQDDPNELHASELDGDDAVKFGSSPYETEVNWDKLAAPPTPGPEQPPEWNAALPKALPPGPEPGDTTVPVRRNLAEAAKTAFRRDWNTAVTSWRSLLPAVTAYYAASKDIEGTGILGTHGLDWQPGKAGSGSDIESLTGQQKVGPHDEFTVGGLFTDPSGKMGTTANVNTAGLQGNKKTREDIVKLNITRDALEAAVVSHVAEQKGYIGMKQRLEAAIRQVSIVEQQVDKDKLDEEKQNLKKKQDEAISHVEDGWSAAEAVILVGFGLGESTVHPKEGAESLLVGLAIAGEALHKASVSAEFDREIDKLDGKINQALASIRGEQKLYAQQQLEADTQLKDSAKMKVQASAVTVREKMAALQSAYDALGEEANKAAGGGQQGARIQAAIEAIPKVEVCVSRIDDILRAANVPAYDSISGRGFNGHRQPADFIEHVRMLKGYREHFTPLKPPWQARLDSLRAIVQRLGPAGGPGSPDANLR
jgi:hypothetical protein